MIIEYSGTVPTGIVDSRMIACRHALRSPPVLRSIAVSAPHLIDQLSFSTSSCVPDETGDAPRFALIFVSDARPIHIGSSLYFRCTLLAGMIIRPVATSRSEEHTSELQSPY